MVQFLVDDTRLTWVTDVKPLILFVFLLITCLGCGDDSVIQYPGAPVITIEKTAFDGWEAVESPVLPRRVNNWDNWLEKEAPHLHYRLKAEELLPYDIEVELSFKLTYYSDHLMEQHGGARDFMYQQRYDMKADRLTYEDSLAMYSIFHHTHTSSEDEIIIRRIRNIVIEILPWTGTGSEPYNVGSPSRIEIKRK